MTTNDLPPDEVTTDLPPFAAVPRWLVEHPDASANAVRAFALLTRWAGLPHGAIPALGTLAEFVGVSRDTMRRAIRDLEKLGAVTLEPRHDERGQTSNRYVLRYHPPSTDARGPHSNGARGAPSKSATRVRTTVSETDVEGSRSSRPDPDGPADVEPQPEPEWSPEVVALTREFAGYVKANEHKLPAKGSKAATGWLREMDRLIRIGPPGDGQDPTDPAEVREVMRWALAVSTFWPANIRSVPKFREQYTTLRAQARRDVRGPTKGSDLAARYADAAENLRSRR